MFEGVPNGSSQFERQKNSSRLFNMKDIFKKYLQVLNRTNLSSESILFD